MAKKSAEPTVKVANLTIPKDEFKNELSTLIDKANDILNMQVTPIIPQDGGYLFGGHGRHLIRPKYDSQEYEEFKKQKNLWVDFTAELLKQSFNIPNNEYHSGFVNTGQVLFVVGNEDWVKEYKDEVRQKRDYLESLIERLRIIPVALMETKAVGVIKKEAKDSRKVFIVHGHDEAIRLKIEQFMTLLGYQPVVLFKEPNKGDTIIEKLEREANDVAFSIVLYTKCDEGKAMGESHFQPRARQNVVFEHGLMCGILGRNKVVALVEQGVEIPGDLSGILYNEIDKKDSWKLDVAREMKAAGLDIDLNNLI